ncbi:MAG: porin [Alphaproteobacteria bacterium]|nr:porin [Alphaproteobacteria bacterium]
MTSRLAPVVLLPAALLLSSAPAAAADIQIDGAYQTWARLYDTLSLNRELAEAEGMSWSMQHRLWLRPKFFPSERIGLYLDVLALDNVRWGDQQVTFFDPVARADVPGLFVDDLRPPVSEDDPTSSRFDVTLWRAWAEVHTGIGTFRVGRQPLHWGMGIWQNDGLGIAPMGLVKHYGDTADRVSWEHLIQDVWVRLAFDLHTAGLVNDTDTTYAVNVAGAYRSERIFGGLQFQYRRSNAIDSQFDLFTFDAALDLRFGIVRIETEAVFQLGNGDLAGGLNDVDLFAAGGAFDASLELDKLQIHAEVGWATGDDDPNDDRIRTFAFDRDYNVGIFLFEQPMPVLRSDVPGQARDGSIVQVGDAVSNAVYFRPRISYEAIQGLHLDAQFLAGLNARASDEAINEGRGGPLGYEIDVGLRYDGLDHLQVGGLLGVFLPDRHILSYADEDRSGFGAPAVGGQLYLRAFF